MRKRYVKRPEDEKKMQAALHAVDKKQLPHMLSPGSGRPNITAADEFLRTSRNFSLYPDGSRNGQWLRTDGRREREAC
jgi:hypothetical protein